MSTQYKGITITTFMFEGKERFSVGHASDEFNQGGYANLNAAKGAITKYLNAHPASVLPETVAANPELDIEGMKSVAQSETEHLMSSPANAEHLATSIEQVRTGKAKPRKLANTGNVERTSVPVYNDDAILRYRGVVNAKGQMIEHDKRSRRQREGRYAGQVDGTPARWWPTVENRYCESFTNKYYMPTRKARKALRIAAKNRNSGKQYGGKITN